MSRQAFAKETRDAGTTYLLSHRDSVSGLTIFADGTRVYWTEGRSSNMVVRYPDGRIEEVAVDETQHPIWIEERRIEEGADVYGDMTLQEEFEWQRARDGRPDWPSQA